jgi:DNA polymerase elongation subunit (family B)
MVKTTRTTLSSSAALFGSDATEGIVAVEPDYEEGVLVYLRAAEGLRRERAPYRPWILLTEPPPFPLPRAEFTELEGAGYRVLAEFPTQALYTEALFLVRDSHLSHLTYPGSAKMALLRSGKTLFKGMTFSDIVRMQIDIETAGLDPAPEENRILLIAVADNRGLIELIESDEREMLAQLADVIRQRDPDVIEGHNIFGFDLPYLIKRAQRHGVRMAWGRDGSEPRIGSERNYAIAAGGNSRPFRPVYIFGRHVLDTYLLVQRFDWAKQSLTGYGLKECARVFGFAEADRVELPRAQIAQIYRDDPELVRAYARQDVIETAKLAELITPVEFYQTQMVPDNYGMVAVTGNGEKINAIFLRACLAAGQAVPRAQPARPFAGGYTEVRAKGVLDRVVKADVESLYPSLMLTHRIAPAADTLGIFLPCLQELTHRRFEAKRKAAAQSDEAERLYWDGLQSSYKVLINSFYGYLGGPFSFNDYDAAETITELGRALVQEVAARLETTGSKVIEIDTDGVYFVPPESIVGEEAERAYVAEIGSALPEGIRLAFDGRFQTMLSVKTKNYVLVTYDGRKIFKGASLRSRADERYGRRFLARMVDCLLNHDLEGIGAHYAERIEDLLRRRVPIEDLARRERITENTFQSEQKGRLAKIAQGIPVGEFLMVYEKSNGELGRLEDYAQDENTRYYMEKLYKFARRLEEAFEGEGKGAFDRCFPKPTPQGLPQNLQTSLDLFS